VLLVPIAKQWAFACCVDSGNAGHKNYLFLPRLAQQLDAELGLASYRFDFRGNGDSDGNINYADFEVRCVFALRS